MAKEAVLIIADPHINSKLGLCKPGIYLEGALVSLNENQKWLWRHGFTVVLERFRKLAKGYEKFLVLDGDVVELDTKYRSWQLIDRNKSLAFQLARETLEPIIDLSDHLFVMRGTEAHTGLSGWAEEELADDWSAIPDDASGTKSWYHLRAEFSGVSFDIAHHYSMGNLPWTEKNAANKLAFETMSLYHEWGDVPPDIVVRGHNHRFADSGRNFNTRAMFCPSWQFPTSYIHRLGKPNTRLHFGALLFLCNNGEYTFHDLIVSPRRSDRWTSRKLKK